MRYTWIDEYLLSKAGVTKDLQKDWNWICYQVGGKMFVAVCLVWETDEPYYITLKLEPTEGDFLRQQYEDIIPGYYMNKTHWNSIKPDLEFPYFYPQSPVFIIIVINNFQKMPKI